MTRTSRFWPTVALVWALVSVGLALIARDRIAAWAFPDPDDVLRLLQVRDWLSGQGWFDVTQHRVAPPVGNPMHWSRLVDLPIAAVELLARPFVGSLGAERVALIAVPLLTLGAAMALLARLARRVLPDERAIFAVCLLPLGIDVVHQLRPMRIDHHGWQMVAALVITTALIGRGARAGIVAGIAAALWLAISVEGLPFVAGMLALVALRWAIDPSERAMLIATLTSLTLGSVALFAGLHAPTTWGQPWCDAMSPVWLAMLVTGMFVVVASALLAPKTRTGRLGGVALGGIAALLVLTSYAPQCLSGPFATLDPVVRDFWYVHVLEGQPVWKQSPVGIANALGVPLIGLIGSLLALRRQIGPARRGWTTIAVLLAIAILATVQVQRGSGVANLLALPGASWVIGHLLVRARAIVPLLPRLAATAGAILLAVPGLIVGTVLAWSAPPAVASPPPAPGCDTARDMAALNALPRSVILAPIDAAPPILVLTRHAIVASAHHRGGDAIRDAILALSGDPERAHAIVRRRGVGYIVVCPAMAEADMLAERNPAGLWARLRSGQRVDWLEPTLLPGSSLRVWRVTA